MFDGKWATAYEHRVREPSAMRAFLSAGLSAPVESRVEPDANMVLPADSLEAPEARARDSLTSPELSGSGGLP
jgi:hypothetical protein